VSRRRRTAERRALEASVSADRQACFVNVGRDNGDGTFTVLSWLYAPESGELLVADMTGRLGAPCTEEVLTISDVKALIKSRVEHRGTFYLHPDHDAEEGS